MLGNRWGLKPRILHWMYTAIVRPIISYGALVWWPALTKDYIDKKIGGIQRSTAASVTGAMRSCPKDVLNVLLDLLPIDIFIENSAANSAIRLRALGLWKERPFGHGSIIHAIPSEIKALPIDYILSKTWVHHKPRTKFASRSDWNQEDFGYLQGLTVFTDGSKMECGVGAGVFIEQYNLKLSFRLPDYAGVFQAETFAIKEAVSSVANF
ncbi:PREDICTED: uncharacterized protein LOC108357952 [Rhagoletis zephyria]|uniref:uncharacterized protein LOC108357952 n=1 Tax=Rhagoletis zephyria TaxID=28612 RepID=UPI0008118886|nr:PREDICTED: uncharacterized protein LOC108357952 [Rhagoletis zephyria]